MWLYFWFCRNVACWWGGQKHYELDRVWRVLFDEVSPVLQEWGLHWAKHIRLSVDKRGYNSMSGLFILLSNNQHEISIGYDFWAAASSPAPPLPLFRFVVSTWNTYVVYPTRLLLKLLEPCCTNGSQFVVSHSNLSQVRWVDQLTLLTWVRKRKFKKPMKRLYSEIPRLFRRFVRSPSFVHESITSVITGNSWIYLQQLLEECEFLSMPVYLSSIKSYTILNSKMRLIQDTLVLPHYMKVMSHYQQRKDYYWHLALHSCLSTTRGVEVDSSSSNEIDRRHGRCIRRSHS